MVVLRGLFCALLLVIPSLALSATPYPLWAISEGDNTFSQQDYKVLAENFIFAHGDFTSAQLNALKAVNPDFIKLKYINTSKTNTPADAIAAETNARTSILHHRIATLTATIDAAQTSFVLSAVAGATLALKPSTAPGNYSVQSDSAQSYVTWLRIGDEFMRVNGWDSGTKTVTVTRGFDGTTAVAHAAGDAVCSPTYCVPNYPGGASPLRYQMDPAGPLRWNTSLAAAVSHKDSGFDGTWYDILGSAPFQPLDINGNDPNDWWDFTKNSNYSRDDFRLYSEMGIHSVQTGFHSQKGVWPIIFGNNMIASSYEVGSGGRKLFLESTAQKPRPIDGYCIESYAFHIEEDDFQQWRQDGSLAPPKFEGYSSWKQNVQMLMKASQAGLAAAPAMMNAGWKTMMFERYPDDLKDRFETYAYASYLIAAHKNGDDCSTPFLWAAIKIGRAHV